MIFLLVHILFESDIARFEQEKWKMDFSFLVRAISTRNKKKNLH
jgi:hypothetical protein